MATITRFDGDTFNDKQDGARLSRQLDSVKEFMLDGQWHTLEEISTATGFPQASVSARLRDLRKPRFGEYTVDRKRSGNGLFAYRVIAPQQSEFRVPRLNDSPVSGIATSQVQILDNVKPSIITDTAMSPQDGMDMTSVPSKIVEIQKPKKSSDLDSLFWNQ